VAQNNGENMPPTPISTEADLRQCFSVDLKTDHVVEGAFVVASVDPEPLNFF
jgi:hypothetical protein